MQKSSSAELLRQPVTTALCSATDGHSTLFWIREIPDCDPTDEFFKLANLRAHRSPVYRPYTTLVCSEV